MYVNAKIIPVKTRGGGMKKSSGRCELQYSIFDKL
jgi:hypothetical protein